MGYVHQILILLHLLLETAALLLLQQVKIVGCIEQGLDETFPGAECRDLGGHCGADPGADHQDELRGPLGLQAGQEFPVEHAGQDMITTLLIVHLRILSAVSRW